jgi:hypothetical protein
VNGLRTVREAQIDGEFNGFGSDMLFALTDNTFWIQDEHKYWYHYEHRPHVTLFESAGRLYLELSGSERSVAVREVTNVIVSRVDGAFTGWNGKTQYKLTNGQTWRQRAYKYRCRYADCPRVIVYETGDGFVMDVAGTRAKVRRVR